MSGKITAGGFRIEGAVGDNVHLDNGEVKPLSEFSGSVTIDAVPTDGSTNAVSSNGTFDALGTKTNANTAIIGGTKTKITYDAKGLVTAGSDATTSDIAESTDKNYVSDAQLVIIGNTSGTNTGDQDLSGKADIASPTFTGTVTTPAIVVSSETASTIASFDASKNVKSLDTATYPSLAELAYVKGLTSALQTQLDAKQPKGVRITNATTTGSYAIDWNAAEVWQLTLTGATTITDTNLPTGTATKVIELVVKGAFAITLPAYWEATPSSGTYTGAKWNHFVVSCIIGTTSSEKVIYSNEVLAT